MRQKKILVPPQFGAVSSWNRAFVTASFSDFLHRNGAVPISVIPTTDFCEQEDLDALIGEVLDTVDGVLLQGGNDIQPSLYGQEDRAAESPQCYRDSFEMALVRASLRAGLPLFGVCRGFQLLQVCCQGFLEQHLEYPKWMKHRCLLDSQAMNDGRHETDLLHPVHLSAGGVLRQILRTDSVTVNSNHHQGVVVLADGLRLEATSPDGLVEAFADEERGILGVQWHPEANFSLPQFGLPLQVWVQEWVRRRV